MTETTNSWADSWTASQLAQMKAMGEFKLGGRTVDLGNVKVPVLNVYAKDDHNIPPKTTQALRGAIGSSDYSEIGLDGGHVGVFVSGKSQGVLGNGIADWLLKRG